MAAYITLGIFAVNHLDRGGRPPLGNDPIGNEFGRADGGVTGTLENSGRREDTGDQLGDKRWDLARDLDSEDEGGEGEVSHEH